MRVSLDAMTTPDDEKSSQGVFSPSTAEGSANAVPDARRVWLHHQGEQIEQWLSDTTSMLRCETAATEERLIRQLTQEREERLSSVKLEINYHIEDRVSDMCRKAAHKSLEDISALSARVADLERSRHMELEQHVRTSRDSAEIHRDLLQRTSLLESELKACSEMASVRISEVSAALGEAERDAGTRVADLAACVEDARNLLELETQAIKTNISRALALARSAMDKTETTDARISSISLDVAEPTPLLSAISDLTSPGDMSFSPCSLMSYKVASRDCFPPRTSIKSNFLLSPMHEEIGFDVTPKADMGQEMKISENLEIVIATSNEEIHTSKAMSERHKNELHPPEASSPGGSTDTTRTHIGSATIQDDDCDIVESFQRMRSEMKTIASNSQDLAERIDGERAERLAMGATFETWTMRLECEVTALKQTVKPLASPEKPFASPVPMARDYNSKPEVKMLNQSQSPSTDVVPGQMDDGLRQAHSSLRAKLRSMMELGKPKKARSGTSAPTTRSLSACRGTPQMPQASGQLGEPTNMVKGVSGSGPPVLIPVAVDVEPQPQQPNEQPQQQLQQQQQKKQPSSQPPRAPIPGCASLLPPGGSSQLTGRPPSASINLPVGRPGLDASRTSNLPVGRPGRALTARENSMPARVYFENPPQPSSLSYSAPASPTSALHRNHLTQSTAARRRQISPSIARSIEQLGLTPPPSARTRCSVGAIPSNTRPPTGNPNVPQISAPPGRSRSAVPRP